jgi:hypothetical protein
MTHRRHRAPSDLAVLTARMATSCFERAHEATRFHCRTRQRRGMANRSKHAADGKIIDRGVLVGDLPTDT